MTFYLIECQVMSSILVVQKINFSQREIIIKVHIESLSVKKRSSQALLYGKSYQHKRLGYYFDRQGKNLKRFNENCCTGSILYFYYIQP